MEMISVGLWVAKLFGKTPTAEVARKIGMAVLIVVLTILAVVAVIVGVKLHDRGVVKQYQDQRDAAVANASDIANAEATANALERANVTEAENQRLENAISEAKAADPEKGQHTVGPVQQSYFDNLPKRR